jgi:hypothetical protein
LATGHRADAGGDLYDRDGRVHVDPRHGAGLRAFRRQYERVSDLRAGAAAAVREQTFALAKFNSTTLASRLQIASDGKTQDEASKEDAMQFARLVCTGRFEEINTGTARLDWLNARITALAKPPEDQLNSSTGSVPPTRRRSLETSGPKIPGQVTLVQPVP